MNASRGQHRAGGLPYALGSHAIWGIMPLYLVLVESVPPVEFVAWRVLWTLPLCAAIIAWRRQGAEVAAVLKDPRSLAALACSASLVGLNWVLYVYAVQTGHVYAASLGYYILPLVMMVLGLVVLGEKLSRAQWWAVALAALGVALLATGALTTLWISVTLAVSFGIYGLIRKTVPVGSLAGLTVETLLLTVPAVGIALWYSAQPAGSAMAQGIGLGSAVALGGPMTAIPLMMFAVAARRMDYSLLGFLQFLSPTIVFLLGLFYFGETLNRAQLACFMLIWCAMALFVGDMLRNRRARSATPTNA